MGLRRVRTAWRRLGFDGARAADDAAADASGRLGRRTPGSGAKASQHGQSDGKSPNRIRIIRVRPKFLAAVEFSFLP